MKSVEIQKGEYTYRFVFEVGQDDPAEGATLTMVARNGRRVAPSSAPEAPYSEAASRLGI